jgi:5'-3' exonuclease
VGKKRAQQLVQEYKTIENIFTALHQMVLSLEGLHNAKFVPVTTSLPTSLYPPL